MQLCVLWLCQTWYRWCIDAKSVRRIIAGLDLVWCARCGSPFVRNDLFFRGQLRYGSRLATTFTDLIKLALV